MPAEACGWTLAPVYARSPQFCSRFPRSRVYHPSDPAIQIRQEGRKDQKDRIGERPKGLTRWGVYTSGLSKISHQKKRDPGALLPNPSSVSVFYLDLSHKGNANLLISQIPAVCPLILQASFWQILSVIFQPMVLTVMFSPSSALAASMAA